MDILKLNKGYIATSTVLILMVVTLSIMVTVSLLGIGEVQGTQAVTKGEQTLFLVDGCIEEVLLRVINNPSYTGGNITVPEGGCVATVESQAGNNWSIVVTNNTIDYKRTIREVLVRSGSISIVSWLEI